MEQNEATLLIRARKDLEWVKSHSKDLREDYNNRFIAVKDTEILASGQTMEDLLEELDKKSVDAGEVLVKFISKVAMVL